MVSSRWPILVASVFALATAAVAAHAATDAAAPARWIVFSAHPNGATGAAAADARPDQRHRVSSRSRRAASRRPSRPSRPTGSGSPSRGSAPGIFRMNDRRDGPAPAHLRSARHLPRLVAGRQADRVPAALQGRVAPLRHVSDGCGPSEGCRLAPPAGRPTWTANSKSILIPSAADIVRVDARTGRIQKYYGLTLDIQTTQNATVSPNGLMVAYLGPRLSTGPEDCGEGPVPAVRALPGARSGAPPAAADRQRQPAPRAGRRTGRP